MTTYAIGDLQGCLDPLQQLLRKIDFAPGRDRLLFAGDLVNRGPASLQVLRFVQSLGASAISVLGNHDLHLIAAARSGRFGGRDTLDEIMQAPDRDALLSWLLRQPLAYNDEASGALLIHAGLPPQWTRAQTLMLAAEASAALNSRDGAVFLARMYGNEPDLWHDELSGVPRLRFIINCLTRLRYCDSEGRLHLKPSGAPGTQAPGLMPWFQVPGRRTAGDTIVFGHWSTLGQLHWPESSVYGLDTGCLWGGCLTALDLDRWTTVSVDCPRYQRPDPS